MTTVAVIGGGIFGCTIALELAKQFEVTLYERSGQLLSGASTNNHLRHHQGYHYPRSKKTAIECIRAQESFEQWYGPCIIRPFPHYLAIAKVGSMTSPEDYLQFCDGFNFPYKVVDPDAQLINTEKISLVLEIPEYSYDPAKMLRLVQEKLSPSLVNVKVAHEIVGGDVAGKRKKIRFLAGNMVQEAAFDVVINATYSNFNSFNKWFGLPRKQVLYELVEMLELELPVKGKLGLSIFDGQFSTVMPRAEEGRFTLAHIKESILKDIVSDDLDPSVMISENIKTNRDRILQASQEDYPILREAKFIRPIYITRVVKANVDDTDERPSEITAHGNGLFTVFSGKVVTCVETAKELARLIAASY